MPISRSDPLHSPQKGQAEQPEGFWQQPGFVAALVLLTAVPLLLPDIPPLIDLPGHMGRYKVQLDLDQSAALQRFYRFEWQLIGNLGVDLLVIPLSKVFGLELAVKLIVLSIPPLSAGGFLWVAREVHGRIPPTALFALPFAYNYPLIFGFVNFALSMALAFLAFALWLRLARLARFRFRAALFVPLSMIIWITHTFGWGALGIMAYSAELVRQYDRGRNLLAAGWGAGLHCLALAPPVILMLAWRSGNAGGRTTDWFNWEAKGRWLTWVLRDRWMWFDLASLTVVSLLILRAMWSPRIEFSRNLAASGIFLLIVFIMLPRIIFGSAYADMRLAPYLFAVAIIGIRVRQGVGSDFARKVALVGLTFTLVRMGGTTASFWLYDQSYERELDALEHVPRGARLVSFVRLDCEENWYRSRLEHLPGLALVRREAFSNDQWTMAGAQLLSVRYPAGGWFVRDPTQIVTLTKCPGELWLPVNEALWRIPRQGFDYIWLIDPPVYDSEFTRGLRPVWRSGTSVLYRVVDRTQPARQGDKK